MNLIFKPSYGNLKTFFHNISDICESVSAGRIEDPMLVDDISEISYIIYKTTGINILIREVNGVKSILEANNLRALETMLFVASRTHELNDNQILSGNIDYREIYQSEIRNKLDEMGLTKVKVTHSWICGEDTIYDYVLFNIDSIVLEYCMNKIQKFINPNI